MSKTLIKNAAIVNEGEVRKASLLIDGEDIAGIYTDDVPEVKADEVIDAEGRWLLPGIIDDHVHFREPGLTHKADIKSESRAAAAGGVTTIFDMPNCIPQTVSVEALQEKFEIAAGKCLVNYSFYLGATKGNPDAIEAVDPRRICGIKVFMGSSTGGMLLNDEDSLKTLFRAAGVPVAVHCEETAIINANIERYRLQCGGNEPPVTFHPLIRSEEACYASTSKAIDIAAGTDVRLHILHISTARELSLFERGPVSGKRITAEACPAHLTFTDSDYPAMGTLIKCNPAIKTIADRSALREALTDGRIDVVGTDHAPHLLSEKRGGSLTAASGIPVLPYSLPVMLELTEKGILGLTDVVRLMCHNPAALFNVKDRGYIRKGYKADLTMVSRNDICHIDKNEFTSTKYGWNPFENRPYHWRVSATWVNGHKVYNEGIFDDSILGQPVIFER